MQNERPADIERMVRDVERTVRDERVLAAMRAVPRHRFVPDFAQRRAYDDSALPIGAGQTISQPLIVGIMTEALTLTGDERVLEIGTGSGYQAAVLARLVADVVSVEVVDELRERAAETLAGLGVRNVRCLPAGEDLGAPAHAPFDAIIVTAAAPELPRALIDQLREGGRIVIPVGSRQAQELMLARRRDGALDRQSLGGCRFVPLIGPGGFLPRRAGEAPPATER